MLRTIASIGSTAIATVLFTANQAAALCLFGIFGNSCGSTGTGGTVSTGTGTAAAPEFDGPGAVAAAALLVSVGAMIIYRARR